MEARPFCYDWRLSLADSAKCFAAAFDLAAEHAARRNKPLYVAAAIRWVAWWRDWR